MKGKKNSDRLLVNLLKAAGVDVEAGTMDDRAFDIDGPIFKTFMEERGYKMPSQEEIEREYKRLLKENGQV
ncbi:MAG: hypothetical protein ABSG44_09320 [Thermodesulfobacteriota bacterium]|jgi:hypothetical protein